MSRAQIIRLAIQRIFKGENLSFFTGFEFTSLEEAALLDSSGREYLLKLLETSQDQYIFSDKNILRNTMVLDSKQLPQVSIDEKFAEYGFFESKGLEGERWKFSDENINNFFISLFQITASKFCHDIHLNDLYHAHLVFIDYVPGHDLAIILHAKEAPDSKLLNKFDRNLSRLRSFGTPFKVDAMKHRNIIYLLRSNKLLAYNNFDMLNFMHSEFDKRATTGYLGALERVYKLLLESRSEVLDTVEGDSDKLKIQNAIDEVYRARELSPAEIGYPIGDVNIISESGCQQIAEHLYAEEFPKQVFYFLTKKSTGQEYQEILAAEIKRRAEEKDPQPAKIIDMMRELGICRGFKGRQKQRAQSELIPQSEKGEMSFRPKSP